MKLSKSESLFLYGLLFNLVEKSNLKFSEDTQDLIIDLHEKLARSILGETSSSDDSIAHDDSEIDEDEDDLDDGLEDDEDDEDDEDEDDDDDEESIEADEVVEPFEVEELPSLKVSQGEKKVSIEFSANSEPDSVDVFIGDSVAHVAIALQINDNTLVVHTREDEHVYQFEKLPKKWSKFFKNGYVYAFQKEDE